MDDTFRLDRNPMQHARQQRIIQLTGSNQRSILQLLQAYENNKENDLLLKRECNNLLLLAERIAVISHFNQKKLKNTNWYVSIRFHKFHL